MRWPTVRQVQDYRRQVYGAIRQLIETHPDLEPGHRPILPDSPLWALAMGFEHERIHIETTSVLMRELPVRLLQRPPAFPDVHPSGRTISPSAMPAHTEPNTLIPVAEGMVQYGKPWGWPSFGWDNEYGEQEKRVRAFAASRQLISNGEFHAFVQAGGYREQRFWTDEGWQWRTFRNTKWPTFWVPDGPAGLHRYKLRTLFDVIDMPWDWPAVVNYHEAKAYCAWRTEQDGAAKPYRLLTEAEHHRLRPAAWTGWHVDTQRDPAMRADGHGLAADFGLNLGLAYGSESPVTALKPADTGFHDVFGNIWQWCEDHFHPLPGAKVHPYYDDFSTPCYDGKQQMILGGSFISIGDEASIWARFHFRPHFYQHAGFRLAQSIDGDPAGEPVHLNETARGGNVYETEQMVNDYMVLHYGEASDQMPYAFGPQGATAFPQRCASLVVDTAKRLGLPLGTALDVGCAVGGSTFALARAFDSVIGVDLSAAFIEAAKGLQRAGSRPYFRKDEGDLGAMLTATVDPAIDRQRLTFRQADACSLPAEFIEFDAVLMANLLCRLPSAKGLLSRLAGPRGLVKPGGLLVLTTPFSWLEQFTPREVWLGGAIRDGHPVWSADTLKQLLEPDFELLDSQDMPCLIREHARKYQYIVPLATIWRRRA
jgi:5-histidylcysteine sulfoxide synthase/putative 4-mercaptohistidine N1-methyltranferase